MEKTPWKSPRKIEEEVTAYKRTRFEYYMLEADEGRLPRALAITALREELDNIAELSTPPTADML